MIYRIRGDSKDCVSGRLTNPANPCIIQSSLETLNMLPGESNGESVAGGRRSRAKIVSYPRSEHNARPGAIKQESSPVNTINEGRRPGTKKRGRQRKDGDTTRGRRGGDEGAF